jgi:hypothetical protein
MPSFLPRAATYTTDVENAISPFSSTTHSTQVSVVSFLERRLYVSFMELSNPVASLFVCRSRLLTVLEVKLGNYMDLLSKGIITESQKTKTSLACQFSRFCFSP